MAEREVSRQTGTSRLVGLVAFVGAALATGWVGSIATTAGLQTWYPALEKPMFTPPSTIFPLVWTILYVLMGLAAWLVWNKPGSVRRNAALAAFFVQLALNAAWLWAFFGAQSTRLGLGAVILLLLAVAVTTMAFWRLSRLAALLLLPTLAWVAFATVLGGAIFFLN
ncbi:MAG: TspO/MBR family protein [Alphaproteobacteria bacterium]